MASEYLRWKYRDVQPEQKVELTKEQRRRNWWYYHKWHAAIVIVLLLIGVSIIRNAVTQVCPDYQIAYVGEFPLSDEDAAAWEERLAALGTDCNGDGKVIVKLNQYPTTQSGDAMYAYASNVKLMADVDACESYFFLLEDPEGFQVGYELLEGDWIALDNGLYLARRDFWEHRTPENMEDCEWLWDALKRELIS